MTAEATRLTLANERLQVEVSTRGAELQSVTSDDGRSWLWHGDAAYWAGRAPLLFPVVGRSPNDQLTIAGQPYPMAGHGFARQSHFGVVDAEAAACRLRLAASATTRVHYPFEFELDVAFELRAEALHIAVTISNRGAHPMPTSFGFHPALRWPLPGCEASEPHRCWLDAASEPPLRRAGPDGLMLPGALPSPFSAGELVLQASMFDDGALIFPEGAGPTVHYGVRGKPGVRVDSTGLAQLGLWSKPGAPFVCIEPWCGLPPDTGASDALEQRPGHVIVAAGASHRVAMMLSFGVALPDEPRR